MYNVCSLIFEFSEISNLQWTKHFFFNFVDVNVVVCSFVPNCYITGDGPVFLFFTIMINIIDNKVLDPDKTVGSEKCVCT